MNPAAVYDLMIIDVIVLSHFPRRLEGPPAHGKSPETAWAVSGSGIRGSVPWGRSSLAESCHSPGLM